MTKILLCLSRSLVQTLKNGRINDAFLQEPDAVMPVFHTLYGQL